MGANSGWDDSSGWDDEPDSSWRAPEASPASGRAARPPSPSRRRRSPLVTLVGVVALVVALMVVARAPVTRTFHPAHVAHPALGRPVRVVAAGAGAGREYAFPLPSGWRDQTRQLAGSYRGVRPVQVLTGRATSGFVADLSVLRQPAAQPPSLPQLAAALPGRLRDTLGAVPVGSAWPLQLDSAAAIATDWTLAQGGHPVRVRQIACYHHGAVWWLTFSASTQAFPGDVAALDRAVRAWRWTT